MARVIKILLWVVGGFVTLFVVAAVALYVFFDPNDFREEISSSVKNRTGRDLVIEGDISLDLFPWLAVSVGKSSLGNAPGFGDDPLASFDKASFSIRLLPVILRQEVVVGAADIEGLRLNLVVNDRGSSNWSDLIPEDSAVEDSDSDAAAASIDVNSIEVIDAVVRYTNLEAGETITLDAVNLKLGRLKSDGSDVPFNAALRFDVQPAGLSGEIDLDTTLAFNADTGVLQLGKLAVKGSVAGVASIPTKMSLSTDGITVSMNDYQVTSEPFDLTMLDMRIAANVQPFSYEDRITPKASIAIDAFSPRTVMRLFDVEPPETADPGALSRMIMNANAQLTTAAIELTDVDIKLDDTSLKGSLSVPRVATGFYQFDLVGDSIELARYMEPADESSQAAAAEVVPVEIPADMIRPLNVRGKLKIARASLGNIVFENVDVGINSSNGKMRIFPVTAGLFGGAYNGDVRIDVSERTPSLSLNEKVVNVDLARLVKAMFEQDNVTGTINGTFALGGSGVDTNAIQRDLSGNMSLELKDGTYEGVDVWYELRRARALLKGEEAPTPELPAKTAFSSVRMTGVVAEGVMHSDDLFAELPFMQLTGGGRVDIPTATIDYNMTARVFEKPELVRVATPEEIAAFTKIAIPLKITGPLASPSIKPDVEALLRKRVEDEVKDKLKDKLKDLFD
jgi:AsmA protein